MDGISGVFRTQSNIYNLVFFQLIRPGLCSGFQLSRPGLCFNMKFDFFGMVTTAI